MATKYEHARTCVIKELAQIMNAGHMDRKAQLEADDFHKWGGQGMPFPRLRIAVAVGVGTLAVSALLAVTRIAPADTDAGGESKAVVKILTSADGGSRLELRVGDVLVVRLPENPSTGFVWSREGSGGDALRLVRSEYLPTAEGAVGGGGQRSFSFRAIATGTVEMRLKLWREWEGDKSIVDRFVATVRVMRQAPQAKQ